VQISQFIYLTPDGFQLSISCLTSRLEFRKYGSQKKLRELIGKVKLFVSNHAADQQPNSNLPGCPCSFFILKCLNLKANNCRVFAFDVSLLSYPQLLPAKLIKFIFRNIICVDDLHMHQPVILKIKSKQIVPLDHICQLTPFHDPLSR
jgi:hypothetical protein